MYLHYMHALLAVIFNKNDQIQNIDKNAKS